MKKNVLTHISALTLIAFCDPTAHAGVRHSRSLGGTGQPIPKTESRQPNPNETQPIQGGNAIQGQQPYPQQQLPTQMQGGAPQVPPYQPMIVPPPVPVQVPTQMSFEPPVQVPQPAQGASPAQVQTQVPVQVPAQVPVLAPVQSPQQPNAANDGQTPIALPQAPIAVPAAPTVESQPATAPQLPIQAKPSLPPLPAAATLSDRYVRPSYGMAGCGLGSMIFKNNLRSEQWLASIVNDLIIPQSLVITTGTSNCVDVDEEQMQAEQEIFIDTNFHALRTESARGEGENLRAFADLLGCQKEGLFDSFASSSQGQHTYIFSDSQPASIAERYREVLKRSRALKSRCERLF
ncbi:MAG: DUF3015 family protein [Silvanigrellaceae bacterium]